MRKVPGQKTLIGRVLFVLSVVAAVLVLALLILMIVLLVSFLSIKVEAPRESCDYSKALPVFPGAEGFGTDTRGGRSGAVIHVTTLGAEGPGSLRAAIETRGPRIVVFDVGGVIRLKTCLEVREPYLTIAGQTAPGGGITITGAGLEIRTHDVLVQHLRLRIGDNPEGPDPGGRDGLSVYGNGPGTLPTERVVIDHCSVSWAIDEGMSLWTETVQDVTFRYCILAENLSHSLHPEGEHSKGLLIGDHAKRVSVIGCLFAHNFNRNPFIKGDVSALVANNVIYNPGELAIHFDDPEGSGPSCAPVLNNVLIPGADTPWYMPMILLLTDAKPETRVYQSGNDAAGHITITWLHPWRWLSILVRPQRLKWVSVEPLTLLPTGEVVEEVLKHAGARPAQRDEVDARIVKSVRERTGRIIDSPSEVGGLPGILPVTTVAAVPPNPTGDDDGDGYTNIEEWLQELAKRAEE